MDELIEQMAEAICDSSNAGSLFPWASLDETYREQWLVMTLAALGVIAAHPKFELVELPEPVHEPTLGLTWPVVQHWGGQRIRDGEVWIRASDGKIAATSTQNPHACLEDARSYAAALLAAAKAAEGRKGGSDE